MDLGDRRQRERAARRRLIITTARSLAEAEGWDAVTTRRLATAIEYSQPVLYRHFAGMEQISDAVAIDGFDELTEALRAAGSASGAAHAYLDFAREHPAVYDAMFTRTTTLRFGADDTPRELEAAFSVLRDAVGNVAGDQDADTLTEVFWAALHGLVILARTGRLRPGHESERLQRLVGQFANEAEPLP